MFTPVWDSQTLSRLRSVKESLMATILGRMLGLEGPFD
jgi:hypothetical protein